MPNLTVDGQEIEVPAGATVLQACELAGKEIPRFRREERAGDTSPVEIDMSNKVTTGLLEAAE